MHECMIEDYKRWLLNPTKSNFERLGESVMNFSQCGLRYKEITKALKGTPRDVIDEFEKEIRREECKKGYDKGWKEGRKHQAEINWYFNEIERIA